MAVSPAVKGVFCAFIATLIWSGNFILSRSMAADVPPVTLAVIRWSVALVFMLILARRHLKTIVPHLKSHWRYLLLTAFLGIACFNTFIYIAGHTSKAINMSLLASTSPMFTWLLVWILRIQPVQLKSVGALIIAVIGVLFIVTRGDIDSLLVMEFTRGDLWALAAAISFAAYSISLRGLPQTLPYTAFLVIIFSLGALMLLPFMAAELANGATIVWHDRYVWNVLYLSLGMSVIAYLLWIKSISLIGPGNTSMIYYSLPVMTSLEAIWLLNEQLATYHIVGGMLIIGGISLTMFGKRK